MACSIKALVRLYYGAIKALSRLHHLNRLAQTHLVRKDAAHIIVVEVHQPVHALNLVRLELQRCVAPQASVFALLFY